MFEAKYVAVAMSICSQLNWACNFIIGLVFPYMNQYLGPFSFGPFALVLLLAFIFAATILPETQGKNPQDLIAEMTRRNSRNMVYEVNEDDAGAIDLEWRKAMEQLMSEEEANMQQGTYGTLLLGEPSSGCIYKCSTNHNLCVLFSRLWLQACRGRGQPSYDLGFLLNRVLQFFVL